MKLKIVSRVAVTLCSAGALLLSACGSSPTPTAAPTGTPAASPTPRIESTAAATPSVDYEAYTEEALSQAVDRAADEASAEVETAADAITQAAADRVVTQDEAAALSALVGAAQAAVDEAFVVLDAYTSMYGDLAEETSAALTSIENDLNELAVGLESMAQSMASIDQTMQQGLALAEDVVSQLESAAQDVSTWLVDLEAQTTAWLAALPIEQAKRAEHALATAPTETVDDRVGAIRLTFAYLDTVKVALADGRVLKVELEAIAEVGASAAAGLKAHGGSELQGLADRIDALTAQFARGELPQARIELDGLERALPTRPGPP